MFGGNKFKFTMADRINAAKTNPGSTNPNTSISSYSDGINDVQNQGITEQVYDTLTGNEVNPDPDTINDGFVVDDKYKNPPAPDKKTLDQQNNPELDTEAQTDSLKRQARNGQDDSGFKKAQSQKYTKIDDENVEANTADTFNEDNYKAPTQDNPYPDTKSDIKSKEQQVAPKSFAQKLLEGYIKRKMNSALDQSNKDRTGNNDDMGKGEYDESTLDKGNDRKDPDNKKGDWKQADRPQPQQTPKRQLTDSPNPHRKTQDLNIPNHNPRPIPKTASPAFKPPPTPKRGFSAPKLPKFK